MDALVQSILGSAVRGVGALNIKPTEHVRDPGERQAAARFAGFLTAEFLRETAAHELR